MLKKSNFVFHFKVLTLMEIISEIYTYSRFCSFVSVLYELIFHNEKNILSNTKFIYYIMFVAHYYATFTLHLILNVHTWDTKFYSSLSSLNLFEMLGCGNIHIDTPNIIY